MRFEVGGSAKQLRIDAARSARTAAPAPVLALPQAGGQTSGIAVGVLAVGAFLLYSRIIELFPVRGLFLALSLGLLLYAMITRRLGYLRNTPTALLLFMTVWMVPAGLLGIYPGGSAAKLTDIWARSLLAYVVVVCMATDTGAVRRVMAAIAWCLPAFSILSIWLPDYVDGRLMIRISTLANPNDFALFLVVALPFGVWYATDSCHRTIFRFVIAAGSVHAIVMLVQTGSRGGLISAVAVLVAAIVLSGPRIRIALAIAVVIAGLVGAAAMPQRLQQRYMTIVYDDVSEAEGEVLINHALGSKNARLALFLTSLRVTVQHPLFGVGPGMFPDYIGSEMLKEGRHGAWHQTHNAYTQMSAEAGIPAALAYLGVVLFCWTHANRIRKAALASASQQRAAMASCLIAAMAGYTCSAMFSSIALAPVLPLIAGITVGLEQSFRKELLTVEPAVATAAAGTGSR